MKFIVISPSTFFPNEHRVIESVLKKTFNDWRGDLEQVDDMLIIGIRI